MQSGAILLNHVARHIRMFHPGRYRRHVLHPIRMLQGFHRTAIGVSTDDDVTDLEHLHCVLDGSHHTAHVLRVRRHDVADVAIDKQLARLGGKNHLGHHARVGAGDEHGAGTLALSELAKQRALAREDFVAKLLKSLDQTFHGGNLKGWAHGAVSGPSPPMSFVKEQGVESGGHPSADLRPSRETNQAFKDPGFAAANTTWRSCGKCERAAAASGRFRRAKQ